ncbi:MAG TPA: protease inhibitor I42 family protein [Acidimicrobiia bacterium]|nr:protease inhibitor I42 family protein [Acidimicrobiia bacterium]
MLLLAMHLGACSTAPRTITFDDDGAQIDLGRGEEVELILPGNPSTGYLWVVTEVSPILSAEEPEFRPESTLVGAPGEYHFRFTGNEPGTVLLVADYERPFEEAEPLDTFEVEVTVK